MDLTTDVVFVHRDPRAGGYASVTRVEPSGTLEIRELPRVSIAAATIFP